MTGKRYLADVLENESIGVENLANGLYILQVGDTKTSFVIAK